MMDKVSKLSLFSSSTSPHLFFFFTILFLLSDASVIEATTDPADVRALQVFYTSLNSPSQLSEWKSDSGDPCGESWKGITCEGSSVVAIQVSGMGLTGTLGYLLSDLFNLKTLDLSDNSIHDSIPYQMPPNLTTLNLAKNNLTGNLPYSISLMTSLNYLNVSQNSLAQSIGDIPANLQAVSLILDAKETKHCAIEIKEQHFSDAKYARSRRLSSEIGKTQDSILLSNDS